MRQDLSGDGHAFRPHVAAQVQAALPPGWRRVLAAVDGATIEDVPRQMRDVPEEKACR